MGANNKLQATYHGGEYTLDTETERRIRSEVCRVVANVSNWPAPVGTQMLGRDLAEPIDRITEALIPLIREAKAEAWDECANHISDVDDFAPPRLAGELKQANPYKETE